jgi:hypothetical protein
MPLPDIPVGAWIADQQQQFRKITDPLFPAFEFEQAAQEMPIPHDYPLAGGPDQWDQARQQEIERQLRDQQAQDEAAQRQREQEIEQQLRAEQQAQEQAATSMATDAGIPTPDTALATFQQAAQQGPSQDNTSTVAFGPSPGEVPVGSASRSESSRPVSCTKRGHESGLLWSPAFDGRRHYRYDSFAHRSVSYPQSRNRATDSGTTMARSQLSVCHHELMSLTLNEGPLLRRIPTRMERAHCLRRRSRQ